MLYIKYRILNALAILTWAIFKLVESCVSKQKKELNNFEMYLFDLSGYFEYKADETYYRIYDSPINER